MKKSRAASGTKTSNGSETALKNRVSQTSFVAGPTRLLLSHCPGCGDTFDDQPPYMVGKLVRDNLTRAILYQLCKPCGLQAENGGRKRRQILTKRIERNLEAHGAFVGITRTGLWA